MIVLDTHVWVWWVSSSGELSSSAQSALERARLDNKIYISSISAWEVAMLVQRGRLELTMGVEDWIARSESLPYLQFVPIDNRIATRSTRLPGPIHSDPADRMIVSTALTLGAPLVTKDEKLRSYPHLDTVW
jgi:PIN domain nuclease of toxin-antitoxin system